MRKHSPTGEKMKGELIMKYGYVRVSTINQHEDRQMVTMQKHEIAKENIYLEKISGKNTDRPELQKLLAILEPGDVVIIHDFSRLSRSTSDLLTIVETFSEKGVTLISNKENLDTSTPTGKLMLTMIGAINEFERTNLLERQAEGIRLAKERGAFKKKEIDMDLFESLKRDVEKGMLTVKTAAAELGISRQMWYKLQA